VSESDEWTHDDPSIKDDEVLYRRVPKDEDPKKKYYDVSNTVDRISGTPCLGKGALSLNDADKVNPGAGLSIQIEGLMQKLEIPTAKLVNWDTHGVGRFHAGDVRRGRGGVIAFEDLSDEILGKAHGLIRTKSASLPRPEWSAIRSELMQVAIWYESDPGYEKI
jgi:hypothetical protein